MDIYPDLVPREPWDNYVPNNLFILYVLTQEL